MAKQKRFVELYKEGTFTSSIILVDTLTGVNYLYVSNGSGCGLTPLLDAYGHVIVSPLPLIEE